MSEIFEISKLDAAQRQLIVAIDMLFEGKDPVIVHTLAGASSILFSDLVEILNPAYSWDRMAQEDSNISAGEYFRGTRKAQNFLKHAKNDHESKLLFDPNETDSLIMIAIMNASEISSMPIEFQVFQLWYLAGAYPKGYKCIAPFKDAISKFGDLRGVPRTKRLNLGKLFLAQAREKQI